MSARTSAAQLIQAMKELSVEWGQTKEHWRDIKSREFEEKFLSELPVQINRAVAAIEEIEAIMRKVHSDCE